MNRKKIFGYMLAVLVLMAHVSCLRDEGCNCTDASADGTKEVAIRIGDGFDLSTRSAIHSSEPVQHIEHMYAYVFASDNDLEIDLDEDNLTCIYEEKLPWEPVEKLTEAFRCKLDAQLADNNPDKNYLLLVVGVDNNKDTYSFPLANSQDHLGVKGQTIPLTDLQFQLKDAASQMAYTELFAGATVFQSRDQLIEVELTRRVAGLLCYVTDIPAQINEYDIVGMQLRATTALKTTCSLAPRLVSDGESSQLPGIKAFQDAYATGTATDAGGSEVKVIAEVDLEALGAEAGPDGTHLYIPATAQEGVLQTLQNTALLGAYCLPMENTGLRLVLKGKKTETTGGTASVTYTYFETEGQAGNYGINNESGLDAYPLKANHIYSLGSKPLGDNTDNDRPASLDGTPLVIKAADWSGVEEDFVFPSVTLTATITSEKNINSYIYDCISCTDRITIRNVKDNTAGWTLSSAGCDWLFIRKQGETDWSQYITGTEEEQVVEILLNDYVNPNVNYTVTSPANDYRTASLVLTTLNSGLTFTRPVRQYNALIVESEDVGKIGFSRLDRNDSFDNDGNVVQNDEAGVNRIPWGFDGTETFFIYGSNLNSHNSDQDGVNNYNRMLAEVGGKSEWSTCAVNLSHITACELDKNNTQQNNADGKFWYLPAIRELDTFMRTHGQKDYAHILVEPGSYYWSSTCKGTNYHQTYVSGFHSDGSPVGYKDKTLHRKDDPSRIRQARRL